MQKLIQAWREEPSTAVLRLPQALYDNFRSIILGGLEGGRVTVVHNDSWEKLCAVDGNVVVIKENLQLNETVRELLGVERKYWNAALLYECSWFCIWAPQVLWLNAPLLTNARFRAHLAQQPELFGQLFDLLDNAPSLDVSDIEFSDAALAAWIDEQYRSYLKLDSRWLKLQHNPLRLVPQLEYFDQGPVFRSLEELFPSVGSFCIRNGAWPYSPEVDAHAVAQVVSRLDALAKPESKWFRIDNCKIYPAVDGPIADWVLKDLPAGVLIETPVPLTAEDLRWALATKTHIQCIFRDAEARECIAKLDARLDELHAEFLVPSSRWFRVDEGKVYPTMNGEFADWLKQHLLTQDLLIETPSKLRARDLLRALENEKSAWHIINRDDARECLQKLDARLDELHQEFQRVIPGSKWFCVASDGTVVPRIDDMKFKEWLRSRVTDAEVFISHDSCCAPSGPFLRALKWEKGGWPIEPAVRAACVAQADARVDELWKTYNTWVMRWFTAYKLIPELKWKSEQPEFLQWLPKRIVIGESISIDTRCDGPLPDMDREHFVDMIVQLDNKVDAHYTRYQQEPHMRITEVDAAQVQIDAPREFIDWANGKTFAEVEFCWENKGNAAIVLGSPVTWKSNLSRLGHPNGPNDRITRCPADHLGTLLRALRTAWTKWQPAPPNDQTEVLGKPTVTIMELPASRMLLVQELGQPPRYHPRLAFGKLCKAARAKPNDTRTKLIVQ